MSEHDKRPWTPYTLRAVKGMSSILIMANMPDRVVAEWTDDKGRRCTSIAATCSANALPNDDFATLFAASPDLYKALLFAEQMRGGWREAIAMLEDVCGEPVLLKNMMAALDQLDDFGKIARAALEKAYPGGKDAA